MISKEDRMYFIDPLQPATARKTKADGTDLPLQIVALRYRREHFKEDRLGTVINVTHQRVENNELWWVDSDGDYVYGAQLADRINGRGNVMAIVNDDLFYVGREGGEHHLGSSQYGSLLVDARRSDAKRLPGLPGNTLTYAAPMVLRAAPWAHELMPVEGDSPEVVTAKVARAKQKFIQRHKKGEIYKEGMRRDWLHHLESLRADHDMPTPVFNVGVEGTFLTAAGESVALDSLSEVQRNRLRPITANAVVRPAGNAREGYAHSFVGQAFTVVTSLTANDMTGLMSVGQNDVRYAVFDSLRVHSGNIMETNRFPILVSF